MTPRNQISPDVQRHVVPTRCIRLAVSSLCLMACVSESIAWGSPPRTGQVASARGEQSVFYHDMLEAYERGDYRQARQLAKEYLTRSHNKLLEGKKEGWGRGLRVLIGMLGQENRLSAEQRFGGDEEFTAWLREILFANLNSARSAVATDPSEQAARRRFLKSAATQWIMAVSDHTSREELQKLYRTFQPELESPGWTTKAFTGLDDLLAKRIGPSANLTKRDRQAANASDFRTLDEEAAGHVADIIRKYFAGLVAEDAGSLEFATGLDREACAELLDSYHDDYAEEGIAAISNIILPDLSADNLRLHFVPKKTRFYTLTIAGIRIDAVRADGSAFSRKISKHLTLRQHPDGQWTVVVPQR